MLVSIAHGAGATVSAYPATAIAAALLVDAVGHASRIVCALPVIVAEHVLAAGAAGTTAAIVPANFPLAVGAACRGTLSLQCAERGIRAITPRTHSTTAVAAVVATLPSFAIGTTGLLTCAVGVAETRERFSQTSQTRAAATAAAIIPTLFVGTLGLTADVGPHVHIGLGWWDDRVRLRVYGLCGRTSHQRNDHEQTPQPSPGLLGKGVFHSRWPSALCH